MEKLTDFQHWLLRFDDKFKTYSNQEIAELAIACGHDRREVAEWQTQQRFKAA